MVLLVSAVVSSARDVRHTMYRQPPAFDGVLHWEIADALRQLGVRADDRVALIGTGMSACRWARLARVRIVAEAPDRGRFWTGSDDERARVVQTLAGTGVAVIVAEEVPKRASTSGWIRLGRSADYAYFVGRPRTTDVPRDGLERTP
jgi:hypothetical protein